MSYCQRGVSAEKCILVELEFNYFKLDLLYSDTVTARFGKAADASSELLDYEIKDLTFTVDFSIFLRLSGWLQALATFCAAKTVFVPRLTEEPQRIRTLDRHGKTVIMFYSASEDYKLLDVLKLME